MALGSTPRRRGRGKRQAFAEINITPFTDVVLVLLIIFMVTAQFIDKTDSSMNLNLPTATQVESLDSLGGIRISIDKENHLFVSGQPSSFETLQGDLAAARQDPQQLVIVEGDRETVLQNVVAIMDAAAALNMPNVVLATATADELPPVDSAATAPAVAEATPAAPAAPAAVSPFLSPPTPD